MASPDLDTPLLKVSRPVAACSRCRSAKIRCDGKLPACSACEKAGRARSCSGATGGFAKGKERSYVASLEAQCERLEARLAARLLSSTAGAGAGDADQPAAHRRETSNIDDLVGDFGFLAVNATSRDFYGIRAATSFAGLLLAVAAAAPLPLPPAPAPLPPHAQLAGLTRAYFDAVHPVVPVLAETAFWAAVAAVYQDRGRFAAPHDRWTLRLALAIAAAARARRAADADARAAAAHVHAALADADDVLRPGSLAGIHALVLLAQYAALHPACFRPWYLVGAAARVATDLGLHQEHASSRALGRAALDARRRTFHCVYALDRFASMALGRPFSFSDDSANVPFPAEPSSSSSPDPPAAPFLRSIAPARCIFQIRHFQSAAYQDMFFSGRAPTPADARDLAAERCAAAAAWFQSCPADAPAPFATLFRLEFLYTVVLVLSPSRRAPALDQLQPRRLFDYAAAFVALLAREIASASAFTALLSYLDIERAYTVACTLLNLLRQHPNDVLQPFPPDHQQQQQQQQQPSPPAAAGLLSPMQLGLAIPTGHHHDDRLTRATAFIYDAHCIFEYAVVRWDVRRPRDDFARHAVDVQALLAARVDPPHYPSPDYDRDRLYASVSSSAPPLGLHLFQQHHHPPPPPPPSRHSA
ncbi:hypothetical protein LOZ57_000138 [Ophidiomyces ophidiicola]|uniref:uncharacterized protein n=1 Tax=Ophidiomyces ophidiicola TaxID=1387563 RepID=UPI0020C5079A|nr:uncharacterized protein LOZ57_000138 [Ophidiomyces ophidiicola]KAI1953797.1 hypothetical protein LOZ57_000138 [Ophidiomyces ophidiicola]